MARNRRYNVIEPPSTGEVDELVTKSFRPDESPLEELGIASVRIRAIDPTDIPRPDEDKRQIRFRIRGTLTYPESHKLRTVIGIMLEENVLSHFVHIDMADDPAAPAIMSIAWRDQETSSQ